MIPKPTTHAQAVQNAILAAEAAHSLMMGSTKSIGLMTQARQAEGWARVAQAWASIAEQLPMEESVVGPDHSFHCTDRPCNFSAATVEDMDLHHQAHNTAILSNRVGETLMIRKDMYQAMRTAILMGQVGSFNDEVVERNASTDLRFIHEDGIWTVTRG